jgi:hypothetical protein
LDLHDKNALKNFLKLSFLTSLSPWGNSCLSGDDSRQSVAMLTARKTFVNDFLSAAKHRENPNSFLDDVQNFLWAETAV